MNRQQIIDEVFRAAKIDPNKQKDLQLIIELCDMCMKRYLGEKIANEITSPIPKGEEVFTREEEVKNFARWINLHRLGSSNQIDEQDINDYLSLQYTPNI